MFVFPHFELLQGRLRPWAKKSYRKGRDHLGSQGRELHLQQEQRWLLGRGCCKEELPWCLSRAPSL